MKVERADITPLVNVACKNLENLKSKIGEDVSNVNEDELKEIITLLHQESNQLTREINQSREIAPLDGTLKTKLTSLIDSIRHMSTFTQALGPQQALLLGVFKRIENCIHKFESKVTKVDSSEPLR